MHNCKSCDTNTVSGLSYVYDHRCTNPYSMNKCLKGLLKSWNYSNKEEKLLEDKMHEWFSDHNIILPLKTFNALAAVSSAHMRWSKITFVGSHRLRNGVEMFVGLFPFPNRFSILKSSFRSKWIHRSLVY